MLKNKFRFIVLLHVREQESPASLAKAVTRRVQQEYSRVQQRATDPHYQSKGIIIKTSEIESVYKNRYAGLLLAIYKGVRNRKQVLLKTIVTLNILSLIMNCAKYLRVWR